MREACGTLYISGQEARRRGGRARPRPNLADHASCAGSDSVVVPCHNEEMNVPGLVRALTDAYDDYLHEIIIVDDASDDATAATTRALARSTTRASVSSSATRRAASGGRCETATPPPPGTYILSMDCDFELIVPELRDLFDAIAAGRDGAIGSRFSHDSILVNYPFAKIVANRAFHLLARLVLRRPVRDISNNLKLYRPTSSASSRSGARTSRRTRDGAPAARCRPRHRRGADLLDRPQRRHGRPRAFAWPAWRRATCGRWPTCCATASRPPATPGGWSRRRSSRHTPPRAMAAS